MRCVVVHEQFISMFGNFGEMLRCLSIGVHHAGHEHGLSASTHAHQHPAHIQICVFGRNKKNFRQIPCCPSLVEQLRVHMNVFDGKRTPLVKKRLLLVSQCGNKCWECLFQVGFIGSCLAGSRWSRDYEQCWFLLAQVVISSRAILREAFPRASSKPVSNFSMGFALRHASLSLSLSGSDHIRNMFHRVLPRRRERIAMPKAPRASNEAPDAPTPTWCRTNAWTIPARSFVF